MRAMLLLTLGAMSTLASAGEAAPPVDFAGQWHVVAGVAAGIDTDPPAMPDPAIIGHAISFAANRVRGPRPMACMHATYERMTQPSRGLFQGTLGEDVVVADARAVALGLSTTAAPTLSVICDNGLFDYHLAAPRGPDAAQLLIMLDRVIYTLERPPH